MMLNKHVGRKLLISLYVQIRRVGGEKISKINKRAALLFGTIEQWKPMWGKDFSTVTQAKQLKGL